jgi:hypothetical protein
MIKKFSEEASINNLGSVQYDREQKYMSEKDKAQARDNIGIGEVVKRELEEVMFANLPIAEKTIRFSFGDLSYSPLEDTTNTKIAGAHNGTWKKKNTSAANIWDYTVTGTTMASEFGAGNTTNTGAFYDYKNPVKVLLVDFTGITDVSRIFQSCVSIVELPTEFDISSMADARFAFSNLWNCSKYPEVLDFSGDNYNVSGVQGMFQNNFLMKKHPKIILKSGVKLLGNFFAGCASLTDADIDCTNITTLAKTFAGCLSLTHVNLHSTESCTKCGSIFATCAELLPENIEGASFGVATESNGMFENCWPFFEANLIIPDGSGRTLSSFDALGLHPEAIGSYIPVKPNRFIEIPNSFVNLPAATKISNFFAYNTNLKVIPDFRNAPAITDVHDIFLGCENVEIGMLRAYSYFKSLGAQITNHTNCFKDCGINTQTGMLERKYIPQSWGGDGPEEE